MYNRFHFSNFVSVCLSLTLISALAADSHPKPPNIVFILADDLGYAELSCYGQKKFTTPNIDRLAEQGMRFTHCYSGSRVCAPSRSALITGLHTGHTPIRANGGFAHLYDEDVTMGEVLKKAGYITGGFGKWGLGTETTPGAPFRQGFDEWFGFYHQVHAHFYYPWFLWQNDRKFLLRENENHKRARYSHDEIHKQALQFIRSHKDQRFLCYIPYTLPHVELTVPEDSLKPFLGKWDEQPLADPRPGYIGAEQPYATHAAMISRLDRSIGEIQNLLRNLNLENNTLLLFSSDNGPQGNQWQRVADFFDANGSLRGYKGEFYEGGIRVPLIACWPGKIKPGTLSHHVCAFWDFLPTFAELAAAESPPKTDGISFAPTLLAAKTQKTHPFLYWEIGPEKNLTQAVRLADWKALRHRENGPVELYDLARDESEKDNVASTHPEIVEKVRELMSAEHSRQRSYGPERGSHTPDDYVH